MQIKQFPFLSFPIVAALAAAFFITSPLTSFAADGNPKTQAAWQASLVGRSTDDTFSSSRSVGLEGKLRVQHAFTQDLRANVAGGVFLETGSSSALFTDEFEPKSRLFLKEARLLWEFYSPLAVSFGALDQSHHHSPLLLAGGTFPAFLIQANPYFKSWVLELDAQAAIPTSRSLSTRATGKENTPILFTQKIRAGWKSFEDYTLILRASNFQYRNLTRGIAQDSRFYGNTIVGIGAASQFFYSYEGFELGPELSIPLGAGFSWEFLASSVLNRKGPKNADKGMYAQTGLQFKGTSYAINPHLAFYRNEADSVPAYFSSALFGHNNRRGLAAGLRLDLLAAGLSFDLKGARSRLIEARTFQKDRFDYLELVVEVPYANL